MLGIGFCRERIYLYSSPGHEDTPHFDISRIHQVPEVIEDYVDTILVEIPVVAEREEIEFQTLALHHLDPGDIGDEYVSEIGLACFGAERGELRTVECNQILAFGMFVVESLEQFG